MINANYEELDTPCIRVDDVETGYLATKELIDHHHKKLLLISKTDDLQGKYRMKGFIKACEEASIGICPDSILTYTTETEADVYEQAIKLLADNPGITGIFCYNDKIAKNLMSQLVKLGRKIPEDYSIIACDDSSLSLMGGIALTSAIHPKEKMGVDAAKWIVNSIKNGQPEGDILYPAELVRRSSIREIDLEEE
ncbi:substrate-binding domain-containing protein [Lactococcus termiticola]|uniref:Arabinose metabolism transcriptional repressor n=2 Tax=Lactococcus termiticola TaxID=2169526 RepID=A0A2R5HE82_9LACT|nr:substrate-binding domain-containing protein [Lactococcus termiticola]GBG96383.1 arabinose metabolism transcriptional repressor [Lactococcus termiticola]